MSEFAVRDKFVVEIAEIYVPSDSVAHNKMAAQEFYRMKGGIPPLTAGQLRSAEFYDPTSIPGAAKWVNVSERMPSENGQYICCVINYKKPFKWLLSFENGEWLLNNSKDRFDGRVVAWLDGVPAYEEACDSGQLKLEV